MRVILAVVLAGFLTVGWAAEDRKPPETKRVCVVEKDGAGKEREVCKNVKVHQKLESQQDKK